MKRTLTKKELRQIIRKENSLIRIDATINTILLLSGIAAIMEMFLIAFVLIAVSTSMVIDLRRKLKND